jgi:hypothetical protein
MGKHTGLSVYLVEPDKPPWNRHSIPLISGILSREPFQEKRLRAGLSQ